MQIYTSRHLNRIQVSWDSSKEIILHCFELRVGICVDIFYTYYYENSQTFVDDSETLLFLTFLEIFGRCQYILICTFYLL